MFFEFYGHERQDYSIACKKCRAEVRCDIGEHEGADAPCSCHHDTRQICAEKWNSRAAVLQGADGNAPAHFRSRPAQSSLSPAQGGNSPVIPDGWVACSERMPEQFVEVLVCTEDGSRYVAALNQSMNWDDGDFFDDIQYVTHWMPLPAAPQQEVNNG
ncbi:TPA: DUF551 domain-containing protein [Enterobacter roggenkampii]|nr:DUF551 domain-containing protein [Enterobacter roggenkampii]